MTKFQNFGEGIDLYSQKKKKKKNKGKIIKKKKKKKKKKKNVCKFKTCVIVSGLVLLVLSILADANSSKSSE